MIYDLLKRIVTLGLRIFFKKIVISGEDNLVNHGPLIIVSNHPNTLMDPLIIAAVFKQQLGFIANASIFRHKLLKKILTYFHVIPIYRKQDLLPGEQADHQKTFAQCHQYLDQGGSVLIFPEGTSIYELKLREIKTGTARIALSMEDGFDFKRGLQILPIALDYTDPIQFRSSLSIHILPTISLTGYKNVYAQNEEEGVKMLTEEIRQKLAEFVIDTSDKPQENFLVKAHKFFYSYQDPSSKWYVNPKKSLEIRSEMAVYLQNLKGDNPEFYASLEKKTLRYFEMLKKAKLSLGFFSKEFLNLNPWRRLLSMFVLLTLLLPAYLFGLLTNYLPYKLPGKLFRLLKLDIEYKAPFQMVLGMILFPIFYFVETVLFRKYVSADWTFTILFLFALPLSGFLAQFCWLLVQRLRKMLRYLFGLSDDDKREVTNLRDELLQILQLEMKNLV